MHNIYIEKEIATAHKNNHQKNKANEKNTQKTKPHVFILSQGSRQLARVWSCGSVGCTYCRSLLLVKLEMLERQHREPLAALPLFVERLASLASLRVRAHDTVALRF
jgi:hypothetical protein